jgi:hypothetical protein
MLLIAIFAVVPHPAAGDDCFANCSGCLVLLVASLYVPCCLA